MSRDQILRGCRELCHGHSVGMEIMFRGSQNAIKPLEGDQCVPKAEFIREGKPLRLEEPVWRVCSSVP